MLSTQWKANLGLATVAKKQNLSQNPFTTITVKHDIVFLEKLFLRINYAADSRHIYKTSLQKRRKQSDIFTGKVLCLQSQTVLTGNSGSLAHWLHCSTMLHCSLLHFCVQLWTHIFHFKINTWKSIKFPTGLITDK